MAGFRSFTTCFNFPTAIEIILPQLQDMRSGFCSGEIAFCCSMINVTVWYEALFVAFRLLSSFNCFPFFPVIYFRDGEAWYLQLRCEVPRSCSCELSSTKLSLPGVREIFSESFLIWRIIFLFYCDCCWRKRFIVSDLIFVHQVDVRMSNFQRRIWLLSKTKASCIRG